MNTIVAILAASMAFAQSSADDFELGGSAVRLDERCIRLTPDDPYRTGSAWYDEPIDLSRPFEMRVGLVLGDKDAEGADGIVFVFHPEKRTGYRGEGMGFAGLVPSLGIEFDTYSNRHLLDPADDHIAAMVHGESAHLGPLEPIVVGNLEDGHKHPLSILWRPSSGLEIHLDGEKRASYPPELVTRTFGGTPVVYWGMTAATGRLSNTQDVCIDPLLVGLNTQAPRRLVMP